MAFLPRDQVFSSSNKLLKRLLLLAGCIFISLAIFARYWAQATLSRQLQAHQIVLSEERLRELSAKLLRIQEEERRAISREIHDELGQQVTAINLDLKLADRNIDAGTARPHLARAIRENEELLQTLHAFATRVRPAVLDDLGLRDAVESHVWDFQARTGIAVEASLCFQPTEIPHDIADHVYRLLQESLNNVAKHAAAAKVWITMSVIDDGSQRRFFLAIRDDGRGYVATDDTRRLGLVGMQERVGLLAGELRMASEIDQGTRIEIWLPLGDKRDPAVERQHEA